MYARLRLITAHEFLVVIVAIYFVGLSLQVKKFCWEILVSEEL